MNETSFYCGVHAYLNLCASSKVLLLVPGFSLNIYILVSLVSCLISRRHKIRNNVAMFILGSTMCNLVNLSLWPLIILWQIHGRWVLGSGLCEVMVSAKHLTSSASFHYVSFISFSIYLTVVCGCGHLVDSRAFLALQLLFPLLPVGLKELGQWVLGSRVEHLDRVNHTCFSFINDRVMRVLMLVKIAAFLPLNLYFYAHVLHAIFRSAKLIHRSQAVNKKLAKVFSLISLITLLAHLPGGVFFLMEKLTVRQEMVKEFLLDLPLMSNPIALLCMNKELQTNCLKLYKRQPGSCHKQSQSVIGSEEQHKCLVLTTESTRYKPFGTK